MNLQTTGASPGPSSRRSAGHPGSLSRPMPGAPRDFPRPPLRVEPGAGNARDRCPTDGEGRGSAAAQATQTTPPAREVGSKEENHR